MRRVAMLVLIASLAGRAAAQCPPSCFGGGGPSATDCFVTWGGITSTRITCTDGDPACDVDGSIDGRCTFGLTACVGTPSGGCGATPLDAAPVVVAKGPVSPALVGAIESLPAGGGEACTEAGLAVVPVTITPARLKPGKATLKVTGVAGGKKDKDKVRLRCEPGRPSLAAHVQPLLTETCTYVGCHAGPAPQSALSLEEGQSLAGLVNRKAVAAPTVFRVKPGKLKKSYLARSVLGGNARRMPDGCPDVLPPVERCLTPVEEYLLLAWIQAGARP